MALFLAACSPSPACNDPLGCILIPVDRPVKIGVLYDFSGQDCPQAPIAYEQMVSVVSNRQIHAHEVRLAPEDIFHTAQAAQIAASRLVADPHVSAVILLDCPLDPSAGELVVNAGLSIWQADMAHPVSSLDTLLNAISNQSTSIEHQGVLIPLSPLQEEAHAQR